MQCVQSDVQGLGVELTNRRLWLNSGCGRLAERWLWVSNRLVKGSLQVSNRLVEGSLWVYKRGVFQEVVDSTRDELFSRLKSFLDLLYTPSGLIFLKENVSKTLCKSYVPIILGYFDSAGPQKGS